MNECKLKKRDEIGFHFGEGLFHVQKGSHVPYVQLKTFIHLGGCCMVYIETINIAGETFIFVTALIILYIWFKR